MKKLFPIFVSILLVMALLAGCGSKTPAEPTSTGAPATEPATVTTEAPAETPAEAPAEEPVEGPTEASVEEAEGEEEDFVYEGDASSYYIDVVYADQISRYKTALTAKWDEEECAANGVSEVLPVYYGGNPLENVGFGFVDLDNDGHWELIIGAIQDAEECPAVFEIWTLIDGEPVMIAQAGAKCQFMLQYVEEDMAWYVASEEVTDTNHGTYYLMLNDGMLEVMQGIVYDSNVDEQNPWYMTYDMDWDVSNDDPIDEDTAYAIMDSNQAHYTVLEYFPYIYY